MKAKIIFLFLIIFSVAITAEALSPPIPPDPVLSVLKAYRSYKDIGNVSINVPTVVEVPFADDFIERLDFAVLDVTDDKFEPHYFKKETLTNKISTSINTIPNINSANKMNDGNIGTYANFLLPENTKGNAQITLSSINPITSSLLTTLLDNNVALPSTVEIRAIVDGQNVIVVAKQNMNNSTVRFPETTSDEWTITFTFGQPLRISELRLQQDNAIRESTRAIRFLAQPDHSYRIYFDPDRYSKAPVGEAGNLSSDEDVLVLSSFPTQDYLDYKISDIDNDTIPDINDNCVLVSNTNQLDINNNGRGDVCDDFDQDGVINSEDNCPDNPNKNQKDIDNDDIGDVCDDEESRLTERYVWLPWVGIGFAGMVLITLFALMIKTNHPKDKKEEPVVKVKQEEVEENNNQ